VAPLIVVESEQELMRAVDGLREAGWLVRQGWPAPRSGLPAASPRLVCFGSICTEADAQVALLAAVGGVGVVAHVSAGRELFERFFEDLSRCGEVEYRPAGQRREGALTREQLQLLEMIADGASLGAAAKELHISRRTADRRLAAARETLGARTTAEAAALLRRLVD
jgi:DNA-binding CsgD family transcriptional regulator